MRKRIFAIIILFLVVMPVLLEGCREANQASGSIEEENVHSSEDGYTEPAEKDEQDYTLKVIEMDAQEQKETLKKLFSFMESCKKVLNGMTDLGAIDEDTLHGMIELGAKEGLSVTCGNRDYNLTNYEKVDDALKAALAGKDAKAEFYQVNTVGVFRYYHISFVKGELFVTSASALFGEGMEPALQQLEKIRAYRWEYTEKGWLIWEKALSRNQEMDMHIFCRILPLEAQCREIAEQYITPVSYFCNNLFLVDWDMSGLYKIEFNDLFEFLYAAENGKRLDGEAYAEGIPKEEFEAVIRRYFDISVEELEKYGRFDREKGRYPWSAIGIRNRVSQLQPSFLEVVRCADNSDGTLTAYVEAVSVEEGLDCYYAHVVTLRRKEDGQYVYVGNQVDREHSFCIPAYRARREFE